MVVLIFLLVVLVFPPIVPVFPLIVLVCPLVVLVSPLVCPLVALVCPLVVSVCPLVVLVALYALNSSEAAIALFADYSKAFHTLRSLKLFKRYTPYKLRKTLAEALILSKIDYGSVVYQNVQTI